jgi:hypothetical protein
MRGRRRNLPVPTGTGLATLVLAGSYTLGAILGTLYAKGLDSSSLTDSLSQSLEAVESGSYHGAWLPLVWRCVRLPGAAVLCGFSLLGLVLIPGILGAEGFSLAFSVSAFLRAYGQAGLVPALAAFGMGSLVGLFALLLVGCVGWSASFRLAAGTPGSRSHRAVDRGLVAAVVALLALQVVVERFAVLPMLQAALENV